jgi:S1-C subfamily serine protease
MTALDWGIVAFTIALALWGYRQGLIVGVMSLVGFSTGALIGSRLAPVFLSGGSSSPYAPLLAALGALVGGAMVAVTLESFALGLRERVIRSRHLHLADGAGGAALVACIALGVTWVFGAVALHAPGTPGLRADVQRSLILRSLNSVMPPSGPVLNVIDRVDPAPSIVGPATPLGDPDSSIVADRDVLRAGPSVVKVLGTACGLGIEGSGWVAGPGLVVTNAHVVAGQDDTTVQLRGQGSHLDATAVWFDPRNDLALLRAPGVSGARALKLRANAPQGTSAAILGFPENGPYHVAAARLGQTSTVLTQDAYGRGPVRRSITSLRGRVRQGNSGGPIVDGRGRVVATIFAATISDNGRSGFGVPDGVVSGALSQAGGPVDTGPCAR